MADFSSFNDHQEVLFSDVASDLSDSKSIVYVLEIVKSLLRESKVDEESLSPELKDDIEVCLEALDFCYLNDIFELKVSSLAPLQRLPSKRTISH